MLIALLFKPVCSTKDYFKQVVYKQLHKRLDWFEENSILTWSNDLEWNDENLLPANIGTFSSSLQAYTCGNCRIKAVNINNQFLAAQFQLCEKKLIKNV